MFTGLIEEVASLVRLTPFRGGKTLRIQSSRVIEDMHLGDSVAVDGVCLSVTELHKDYFEVQAVTETLQRSTLKFATPGAQLNLERAMQAAGRFGGHFVQGHVDGIGKLIDVKLNGTTAVWDLSIPSSLSPYVVIKGSLAVNGVSLTVAAHTENIVSLALIPMTLQDTNLGLQKKGDQLNIEVDILAKYVAKAVHSQEHELDVDQIKSWGYE